MVPDRLLYHTDCDARSCLLLYVRAGQLPDIASVITGELLQAGGSSIYLCLTGVLWSDSDDPRLWFVSFWRISPTFQSSIYAVILALHVSGYTLTDGIGMLENWSLPVMRDWSTTAFFMAPGYTHWPPTPPPPLTLSSSWFMFCKFLWRSLLNFLSFVLYRDWVTR